MSKHAKKIVLIVAIVCAVLLISVGVYVVVQHFSESPQAKPVDIVNVPADSSASNEQQFEKPDEAEPVKDEALSVIDNLESVVSVVNQISEASIYDKSKYDEIIEKLAELNVTVTNPDKISSPFIVYDVADLTFGAVNMSSDHALSDDKLSCSIHSTVRRAVSPTYGLDKATVTDNIRSNLRATQSSQYDSEVSFKLEISADDKSATLTLETEDWWR